jgi:pimeloyl-ACP methyl ester carboxylesterase
MFGALAFGLCATVSTGAGAAQLPPADLPAAIYTDQVDSKYPASGRGVQFRSHGSLVNAQLYRPAGEEPHPTIVLLHGLPGNEQNLDVAQVARRAGWTVISFHYRGSWGSAGKFTLRGGVDDVHALLDHLRNSANAAAWGVDAQRIVLIGHSYGGYVAARASVEAPGVIGVALLAPWDISMDARAWKGLTPARRQAAGLAAFDDVDGRLGSTNAISLLDEIMHDGLALDLTQLAPSLAPRRLLLITATHDDDDDKAAGLLAELQRLGARELTTTSLDSDHGFNSQRIALEVQILRWLATLPGAPSTVFVTH